MWDKNCSHDKYRKISILHADAGEDLSCVSRLLNFLFH